MTEEKNNTVIPRLFSYQGNFDRLAVGFGQLMQMAEVNRFDADFQQVDNIGRKSQLLMKLHFFFCLPIVGVDLFPANGMMPAEF